jgi:hypothetical protein
MIVIMSHTAPAILNVKDDPNLSPICRSCHHLDIQVQFVAKSPQLRNFCGYNVINNRIDTCPSYEREPGSDDE